MGWQGSGSDHYPAADEIAALRKKTIPDGVAFIYSATCLENGEPVSPIRIARSTIQALSRRPSSTPCVVTISAIMQRTSKPTIAHCRSFKSELRARGQRKTLTDDPLRTTDLSQKLKLYKFFAGDGSPDDFVLLFGDVGPSCGDDTIRGIDGSECSRHSGRDIFLDTVSIENTSTRPLNIAGLLGSRMSEPRLRRTDTDTAASSASDLVINIGENLAPGQKLLIQLRIVLAPDEGTRCTSSVRPKVSKSIFDQARGKRLQRQPLGPRQSKIPDYAFGPEYSVAGFPGRRDTHRSAAAGRQTLSM